MAPFSCNGTGIILNNQVLGSQGTHSEMKNRVPKIDVESMENVDSSSSSNKKDELCWDLLLWLREAALDPCNQKPPLEKLRRRQIIKAREHISLSTTEFPWKKRRLDLVENKRAISPPLAKTIKQTSFASSVSCLISSTDSTERSQECICKPLSVGSSRYPDDLSRKRVRNSDFDECNGSISVASTPKKPNIQNTLRVNQSLKEINNLPLKQVCMPEAKITNKKDSPLTDSVDSVDNLSVSSENSQEKHKTARKSPRLQNQSLTESNSLPLTRVSTPEANKINTKKDAPLTDSVDSVDNLSVSSENSEEKHKTARRSPRLHNSSTGDDLPRIQVKIGKRHQAEIPDWIGPRRSDNSSTDAQSDSRYMGTKIWPIEGKSTETNKEEGIGKGRSNSCSCYSKGCGGCIKLHVFKKGLQLQDDLGTAFFTWKFDEMGEEVSKSWTAAEQQCFETLVKTDPVTLTDSFLDSALKRFSGKSQKSILSYYFNVFIPRRMSKQIRLASKLVNSDNEF